MIADITILKVGELPIHLTWWGIICFALFCMFR